MEAHGGELGDLGSTLSSSNNNRMSPIQSLFTNLMSSGLRQAAQIARLNPQQNDHRASTSTSLSSTSSSGGNRGASHASHDGLPRARATPPLPRPPHHPTTHLFSNEEGATAAEYLDSSARVLILDTTGNIRTADHHIGLEMNRNSSSRAMNRGGAIETPQNLIEQLSHFITNCLFAGRPINEATIPMAIDRVTRWFDTTLVYIPHFERRGYNSRISLINVVRCTLPQLIDFVRNIEQDQQEYRRKLHRICMIFRKRLYSVLYLCIGDNRVQMCWKQLMRLFTLRLRRSKSMTIYILYTTDY